MIRGCLIALFILSFGCMQAQSVVGELKPNEIEIGDRMAFKIQATVSKGQQIQWPETQKKWNVIPMDQPLLDSINNSTHYIETIAEAIIDTISLENDSITIEWKIIATAWDSLMAFLPPVNVMIDSVKFSTAPIAFQADFPAIQDEIEMFDIFEAFSDISAEENPLWYWGGRMALLLLMIGILWYLFRKFFGTKEHQLIQPQKSLRERTIIALEALFKSNLHLSNLKEYYFELSMILRRFLSEKYGVSYMEMTTYEIKQHLQKKELTIEQIQHITKILQQSDLVKFAKNQPSESAVLNQTAEVKKLIHEIADLDLIDEDE